MPAWRSNQAIQLIASLLAQQGQGKGKGKGKGTNPARPNNKTGTNPPWNGQPAIWLCPNQACKRKFCNPHYAAANGCATCQEVLVLTNHGKQQQANDKLPKPDAHGNPATRTKRAAAPANLQATKNDAKVQGKTGSPTTSTTQKTAPPKAAGNMRTTNMFALLPPQLRFRKEIHKHLKHLGITPAGQPPASDEMLVDATDSDPARTSTEAQIAALAANIAQFALSGLAELVPPLQV